MDALIQDTLLFFGRHQSVYPLYERFQEKLLSGFPDSRVKVQKSQISFYNHHLYACVSFLKVKKKSELPEDYSCLRWGFLLRWILTGWRRKPSLTRDDGQLISSSAMYPIWMMKYLIGSSKHIDLPRKNDAARSSFEGVVAIHGLTSGFVYSENKRISMERGGRDRLAV